MSDTDYRRVTVMLDAGDHDLIVRTAERLEVSVSKVVRDAITQWLDESRASLQLLTNAEAQRVMVEAFARPEVIRAVSRALASTDMDSEPLLNFLESQVGANAAAKRPPLKKRKKPGPKKGTKRRA